MRDKIRGSLIGGAAGDALGYTIEFMGEYGIFSRYGKGGIQSYALEPYSGKAVISDDTQMTLFTAFAVIAERCCAGSGGRYDDLRSYLSLAYQDWYDTQELSFKEVRRSGIYSEKFIKYPDSMLPVMLKNVYNYYVQRELLNSDEFFKKYRKNKGIISFIDERKFLIDTIHKYDSFYEDIILRGLDRKDGIIRESLINGERTEEQMAVLERMRSLSLFKEYKATVVETRKEVGLYTVLIIFGIILSILLIILSRENI